MSVMRAAFTVGAFILFTRVIGFLRECIMVFCLGAGMHTDALLVALRISNTFRRIFAEGAFNAAFLPKFAKTLNNDGQEKANSVLSDVFSFLIMTTIIFSIIVLIFFPHILIVLVSGFDVLSEKFKLTVTLGRICFPYLIFISIISLFAGVLNTINRFALPAGIHSLLSFFTIGGLLYGYFFDLSKHQAVHLIAICVILSGVTQSYILFTSIKRNSFKLTFRLRCWSQHVKSVTKNMIPGIIGAGIWHLNLLVDTAISSYLPTGTITCVNLADRINQLPLGTLGVALSTALLPTLSKFIGENKFEKISEEMQRCILFSLFITFFASSVLLSINIPTVAVAFQRGLFTEEHVKITASALSGFAYGLPAYVMTKIYSAAYFASGDVKSPVIFGVISVAINVIFLLSIVPFLKYFGLALCTSISAISNAFMLIYFSDKRIKIKVSKTFLYKCMSQMIAAVLTYITLKKLADLYWTAELGDSAFKWLVYSGFSVVAATVFFSTTVVFMRLSNQKEWKLWKKESW